jgi:hypothetical protein
MEDPGEPVCEQRSERYLRLLGPGHGHADGEVPGHCVCFGLAVFFDCKLFTRAQPGLGRLSHGEFFFSLCARCGHGGGEIR